MKMQLLSAAWGNWHVGSEAVRLRGTCANSRAGLNRCFLLTSGRSWLPALLVRFGRVSCLRVDITYGFSTQEKTLKFAYWRPSLGRVPWQPFSRGLYNRDVSCHQGVAKYSKVCCSRHGHFSHRVMLPKHFVYLKPNQNTVCIPLHSLSASDTDWTKRAQVPVAGATAVFPCVNASSLMQCKH